MAEMLPTRGFPTTRWSRVSAAGTPDGPEARDALAGLCAAYWYPIYALVRRRGHDADAALDLTQEYFARLLEKGTLAAADRRKGRFRAFLRADVGFFLADQADRRRALRRGGGRAIVSIDARDAEGRYLAEPADGLTPERLFDRAWALTLLEQVLDRIGEEYRRSGRGAVFDAMRWALTEGPRAARIGEVAAALGMTEAAAQKAVQRLRRRYRDALRESIAATLDDPADAEQVEDELRDLFGAVGR